MKPIAIYGAGGFGREMALMIQQINHQNQEWSLIGFFDDVIEKGLVVDGYKVLGGISEINEVSQSLAVCISVADPQSRFILSSKIINPLISFPTLIHPNSLRGSNDNIFGKGCILTAGTILTTNVNLGDFVIINLACTIGHDTRLGSFCTVMPGCSISGNVIVGDRSVFGTGSRIIQGLSIGDDCMVGAGAVVTKSFGNKLKLLGVPARKRDRHVE